LVFYVQIKRVVCSSHLFAKKIGPDRLPIDGVLFSFPHDTVDLPWIPIGPLYERSQSRASFHCLFGCSCLKMASSKQSSLLSFMKRSSESTSDEVVDPKIKRADQKSAYESDGRERKFVPKWKSMFFCFLSGFCIGLDILEILYVLVRPADVYLL